MTTEDSPSVLNRWEQLSGRGKVGIGCGTLVAVAVLCFATMSQIAEPSLNEFQTATAEALAATPSDTPEPTSEPATDKPEPTDEPATATEPPPTDAPTDTPEPPTEAPTVAPPTNTSAPPTEAQPTEPPPPPPNPEGAAPADEYNCPPDYPVKGNIGSSGRIYHMPGWRSYSQTKPEHCFATAADAEAAGFRAPKSP